MTDLQIAYLLGVISGIITTLAFLNSTVYKMWFKK